MCLCTSQDRKLWTNSYKFLQCSCTWVKGFCFLLYVEEPCGQLYKVVAAHSETTMNLTWTDSTHEPPQLSVLGSSVKMHTSSFNSCHMESTNPVPVVQFSYGYKIDGTGDTFMILVPSMDQYSNQFFKKKTICYELNFDSLIYLLLECCGKSTRLLPQWDHLQWSAHLFLVYYQMELWQCGWLWLCFQYQCRRS